MSKTLVKSASEQPKRVFFLNRTSDILGSFTKTDLESYSNLIRRKVQERCATTQDLMQTIRRIKTGEAGYVTPNEFRFTLIKLGITLPQPVVNDLFNMFDSDRSGTMDFDEFAMWIMNSEFRPDNGPEPSSASQKDPEEVLLRNKFIALAKESPIFFSGLKVNYNFLEFVSEINRKSLKSITEKDIRSLFLIFDPKGNNSVDLSRVKRWIDTGSLVPPPSSAKPIVIPDLRQSLIKVCGLTPDLLIKGFEYARGQKNVHFDEFRRTLLSCGLGQKIDDVRALFIATGGAGGSADIDKMLSAAATIPSGSPAHTGGKTVHAFSIPSRADRKIRQGIRKTYEEIRSALEKADATRSGYIDGDTLSNILVKHCMPLSYQDFRYVVKKVQTHPNNPDRYDWNHFLEIYNPLKAPHELEGGSTAAAPSIALRLDENSKHPYRSAPPSRAEGSSQSPDEAFSVGPSALHDVKRVWISILRGCQRADPNKSGFVNRAQFITALEKNLHSGMNADTMNRLADSYMRRDGLVDYKSCFRNTLSDLANVLPVGDSFSAFKAPEPAKIRPTGPVHPWDFEYIKQQIVHYDDPVVPHWKTACIKPKARPNTVSTVQLQSLQLSPVKRSTSRQPMSIDEAERYMSKFDPKVKSTCIKLSNAWKPMWKKLLVDLHDHQIKNHPGHITTDHMVDVLQQNGIRLTKNDYTIIFRYFRAVGMADVFNYADFVHCCNICRKFEGDQSFAATA